MKPIVELLDGLLRYIPDEPHIHFLVNGLKDKRRSVAFLDLPELRIHHVKEIHHLLTVAGVDGRHQWHFEVKKVWEGFFEVKESKDGTT